MTLNIQLYLKIARKQSNKPDCIIQTIRTKNNTNENNNSRKDNSNNESVGKTACVQISPNTNVNNWKLNSYCIGVFFFLFVSFVLSFCYFVLFLLLCKDHTMELQHQLQHKNSILSIDALDAAGDRLSSEDTLLDIEKHDSRVELYNGCNTNILDTTNTVGIVANIYSNNMANKHDPRESEGNYYLSQQRMRL